MAMTYSKTGEQLTERFEGVRLTAYQDSVGFWTIGYGHRAGVKAGDTCTQEQAETWLAQDTQWAVGCVNSRVTVALTQAEFDALCDLVFNIGCGNFTKSEMLRFLNQNQFELASQEFSKWDHAGGKVVAGLLRRRLAEQQEFQS